MDRRKFLKVTGLTAAGVVLSSQQASVMAAENALTTQPSPAKAKVFFTRDLSASGLKKMYDLVQAPLSGKIAVKLHTGEPNGPNIIPREWVKSLLPEIPNSTIVETNVFYPSPRQTTEGHRETLRINGWNFSEVDILDADGDINFPVPGGKWFKEIAMGKNLVNYDSLLVLTHFKGHAMGGFGGSLKNIAIGCASGKVGKKQLHQRGDAPFGHNGARFMENMAESGKAIVNHFGEKIAYINVMRNMSVDCDCAGTSAAPVVTPDIGILASTDLLAIDQASVDLIYALPPAQRHDLVERMESREGLHQLTAMENLGIGSRAYELIDVS
ncbi:hypothetical protein FHU10_0849 [Serratia fonticola]|uniref:DUF362 domain-containing protein n=1 Tax=Serratia fonticola TaxID=47917 RepID=A0A559T1D3_SERFO|nr:DUF362 domain-containing protein [Serratia fonticola]TQI79087.1 hypothetical protein FHU09_1599 [Serratia fonticola]TQI98891.1 hypothetical protein FHU11_4451 [Serratia fonticola]TVZ68416.1 hypothetical protein FHU10_0849 [Serratia fonticola]